MKRAEGVLRPPWLQAHPVEYLSHMFVRSKEKVGLQMSGGYDRGVEIIEDGPDLIVHSIRHLGESDTYCQYIMVSDPVIQSYKNPKTSDSQILDRLVNIYRGYFPNVALRILGRVVLIAHNWQDQTLTSRYRGGFKCAREHIATYEPLN